MVEFHHKTTQMNTHISPPLSSSTNENGELGLSGHMAMRSVVVTFPTAGVTVGSLA